MKILVFDTETNGLPESYNASIFETDKYPYVMQISYILYDTEQKKIIKTSDSYIKNVEIKEESYKINKISQDMINNGEDIINVLNDFIETVKNCDLLIAHNYSFDKKMLMVECNRNKLFYKFNYNIKQKKFYCTMRNSKSICKIPSQYNKNDFKLPKLIELHYTLFNEDIICDKLHNSLVDCIFTIKCYMKMIHNINIFDNIFDNNEFNKLLDSI